jgi:deoxycytidylate deaminase
MNYNRLTIEEYGCLLSLVGKSRSEDYFTHCSAVAIGKDKRILGISYNGLSHGMEVPEWMKLEENREKKSDYYIHAESNLFSLLNRGECELICLNISPCIRCCNTIAAHSVKRVVYLKEYPKCNKFKGFFDFHKINYEELNLKSKNKILNYLTSMDNFKELI